jgi:hypothetical protein
MLVATAFPASVTFTLSRREVYKSVALQMARSFEGLVATWHITAEFPIELNFTVGIDGRHGVVVVSGVMGWVQVHLGSPWLVVRVGCGGGCVVFVEELLVASERACGPF